MPPACPCQLVVRLDREVRHALNAAASAEGTPPSTEARRRLRYSLGLPPEPPRPLGPADAVARAVYLASAPSREIARAIEAATHSKGRSA